MPSVVAILPRDGQRARAEAEHVGDEEQRDAAHLDRQQQRERAHERALLEAHAVRAVSCACRFARARLDTRRPRGVANVLRLARAPVVGVVSPHHGWQLDLRRAELWSCAAGARCRVPPPPPRAAPACCGGRRASRLSTAHRWPRWRRTRASARRRGGGAATTWRGVAHEFFVHSEARAQARALHRV